MDDGSPLLQLVPCDACGALVEEGADECEACGARMGPPAPAPAEPVSRADLLARVLRLGR